VYHGGYEGTIIDGWLGGSVYVIYENGDVYFLADKNPSWVERARTAGFKIDESMVPVNRKIVESIDAQRKVRDY
jgi:hypothetical protein